MKLGHYVLLVAFLAANAQALDRLHQPQVIEHVSTTEDPWEITRQVELQFKRMGSSLPSLVDWAAKTQGIHMKELAEEYIYFVDVPGLRKSDITVELQSSEYVSVKASKECEEDRLCLSRKINHTFKLNKGASIDKMSVNLENGLLRIHVPKTDQPAKSGFHIPFVDSLLGRNAIPKDTAEAIELSHEDTLTEEMKQRIGNVYDSTHDQITDSYDDMQDMMDHASEQARGMGATVYEKVMDTADNIAGSISGGVKRKAHQGYENVVDAAEGVYNSVKDNVYGWTTKEGVVQSTSSYVADKAGQLKDEVAGTVYSKRQSIDNSYEDAKDKVRSAVDTASDKTNAAIKAAKDKNNAAAAKVREGVDVTTDKVKEGANIVTDSVNAATAKVKVSANAAVNKASDAVNTAATKVKAGTNAAADVVTEKAKEGAGVILGTVNAAYQNTKQVVKDAADATSKKAAEVYDSAANVAANVAEEAKETAAGTYAIIADKTAEGIDIAKKNVIKGAHVAADYTTEKAAEAYEASSDAAVRAYDVAKVKAAEALEYTTDKAGEILAEQAAGIKKAVQGYQEGKEEQARENAQQKGGIYDRLKTAVWRTEF